MGTKKSSKSKNTSKESAGIGGADTTFKGKGLLIAAYIYVFLPVFLFVTLWLRWYVSIPLGTLMLYCCYDLIAGDEPIWRPAKVGREDIIKLVVVVTILVMWVLSSGTGGSVHVHGDQYWKNRLFIMLIDNPWPVRMTVEGGSKLITYYMGYWLPAALIGKLTSYSNALLMLQIWTVLGLYLVWRFLCEKQKSVRVWFVVAMIFFGGLDAVGRWVTGTVYADGGNSYEWWAMFYNIPGFTTQLFWAYNHFVPATVIFCLIDRQKTNKGIILLWCNALLSCTFPAVGMIPFAIYRALVNARGDKPVGRLTDAIKRSVTIANVVGIILALVLTLFLLPNTAIQRDAAGDYTQYEIPQAEQTAENADQAADVFVPEVSEKHGEFIAHPWTTRLWMFCWFFLLEVGLFFAFIYKSEGRRPVYWLCMAVLLVLPWIHVGPHNDFCMRATIPAMFCLLEMVINSLMEYKKSKEYVLSVLIIALLAGCSITTFDTVKYTMEQSARTVEWIVGKGDIVRAPAVTYDDLANSPSFGGTEDSIFGRYLVKR